jgi:putative peptidoglycan lipid II flippase
MVAGVLQLLFQLPSLKSLDLLAWPRWGWRDPAVNKVMRLMIPTLFGSSIAQVNLLLDTVIASLLFVGSQTWLSQADRFLELPLGVFGVALGTVILPSLSRHHVTTDHDGFSRALDWGLRTALMIAVPAMFALMLLAEPMVATLFEHGKYTAFDTRMAALSVTGLSFGLPAFALVKVLLPAFYARQDTRTPVRAGVASLVANMALNLIFVAILYVAWAPAALREGSWLAGISQVPGLHLALGLASALASYLNLALLWRWLKRDGVYDPQPGWARQLLRLFVACAAMSAVLLAGRVLWPDWSAMASLARVWRLAALIAAGGGTYVAVMFAMGFRIKDLRGV